MEQGINVRIIDKATVLSDQALPRGTVVVTAMDNPKATTLSNLSALRLKHSTWTSSRSAQVTERVIYLTGGRAFQTAITPTNRDPQPAGF